MTPTAASTPSPTTPRVVGINGLIDLLDAGRLVPADDTIDVLTHGLRCATLLEHTAPADLELQVAGLVHDLGTVLRPSRPETHASVGADAVRPLLGGRVATLVAGHDLALRYLVTVDVGYRDRLSRRDREHLRNLGGLMDPEERAAFLSRPDVDALLALRRADDAAHDATPPVPGLDHWTLVLFALAATARA